MPNGELSTETYKAASTSTIRALRDVHWFGMPTSGSFFQSTLLSFGEFQYPSGAAGSAH